MTAFPIAMLDETARLLENPFRTAEVAFLEIGEHLGASVTTFSTLTGLFESLPLEMESEGVRQAIKELEKVADALIGIAKSLQSERDILIKITDAARHVGTHIHAMKATVEAISVLAVNAQIAAARLDEEGQDFTVFTQEIGRLATTTAKTMDTFDREYGHLEKLLTSACASHTEFGQHHQKSLNTVAGQVRNSLSAVEDHRRKASLGTVTISQKTREIGEAVAEAIQALQIGDITRQRSEHVHTALVILKRGLEDKDGADTNAWHSTLSDDQRQAVAATVCRLQAAQMNETLGNYEREIIRIRRSLNTLSNDAEALVHMGQSVYGSGSARSNSFLLELSEQLRKANAVIHDCQSARAEVDGLADAAVKTLSGLLDQVKIVRSIEGDMRLVGLNTVLKCGRLGSKGRTLTVIAQELRGYANQTVEDAGALVSSLQNVVEAADAMKSQGTTQNAGQIATLQNNTRHALERLEEAGQALSKALTTLATDGGHVTGHLRRTAERSETLDSVTRTLQGAQRNLHRLAQVTASEAQDADDLRERVMVLLKDHYTMESERDIHTLFDAPNTPSVAAGTPQKKKEVPVAEALEDIFF